ncbi:DnaJ subfamily B member 9 [Portunus trituberculatus]|uniref:DnaJ subfamily B member 9 n=1 Tax=Portunus trituberculatus TaxID=210409 RepID=A0A5B7D060_PORTR|nr:DnaJ subfamily B member 9 [Portunus trituberculatus]
MMVPPSCDNPQGLEVLVNSDIGEMDNKAYETLSDEDKRKEYDMLGHAGYTHKQTGGSGGSGGHQGHAFHFNFDDLFADFDAFGGGFGGGGFSSDFDDDFLDLEDFFGHSFRGRDQFGSHNTFFGPGGHFRQEDHMRRHRSAHNQAHQQAFRSQFQGQFHDPGHEFQQYQQQPHFGASGGRTCRTVTQRVGNMVANEEMTLLAFTQEQKVCGWKCLEEVQETLECLLALLMRGIDTGQYFRQGIVMGTSRRWSADCCRYATDRREADHLLLHYPGREGILRGSPWVGEGWIPYRPRGLSPRRSRAGERRDSRVIRAALVLALALLGGSSSYPTAEVQ